MGCQARHQISEQAAKRQRRKDDGETLVQVWVPADKLEAVKAAIAAATEGVTNQQNVIS